jgi:hypothetical protein
MVASEFIDPPFAGYEPNADNLRSLITHDIVSPLQQLPVLMDFLATNARAVDGSNQDMQHALVGLISRITVAAEELAQLVDREDRRVNPFKAGEVAIDLSAALKGMAGDWQGPVIVGGDTDRPLNFGLTALRCLLRAAIGEVFAQTGVHAVHGHITAQADGVARLRLRGVDNKCQLVPSSGALNARLVMRGDLGTYGWAYISRIAARDGLKANFDATNGLELVLPLMPTLQN